GAPDPGGPGRQAHPTAARQRAEGETGGFDMIWKRPRNIALAGAAAVLLAACGGGGGGGGTSSGGTKLNIAFLPKQVNNAYFDVAASGGQEAAAALKGQFKQVGPSEASGAAQVPFIQTLTQQRVSAIVVSADDPDA